MAGPASWGADMAKRRPAGATDADYLGPAWDWAGQLCNNHRCSVGVVILPTRRAGVWLVRVTAKAAAQSPVTHERVTVEAEFPNAHPQTLSGLVYALLVELDMELTLTPIERVAAAGE